MTLSKRQTLPNRALCMGRCWSVHYSILGLLISRAFLHGTTENGAESVRDTGIGSTGRRPKRSFGVKNVATKSVVRKKHVEEEPAKALIKCQQLRSGKRVLHLQEATGERHNTKTTQEEEQGSSCWK